MLAERAIPRFVALALAVMAGPLLVGAKKTPTPVPAPPTAAPTAAAPAKASAPAPSAGASKDVAEGKALYEKNCKKCHGAEGEGVQRMYSLVDAKIVHLGSKQAQAKSDAEIKKAMLDGLGKMEAVEDLTPEQASKILAFERTLHQ